MKFLQNNLLLIGSGKWPQKINSIVKSQNLAIKITNIGAREFLKLGIRQVELLLQGNIVWIASTPENQLLILELIKNLSTKVIIEKPFALNMDQLNQLFTNNESSNNKLYVSEPWRHSRIWSEAKNRVIEVAGLKKLQINRGGPIERDYIDPPWDWMQHDLGLLSELLFEYQKSLEIQYKFTSNRKNLTINIECRGEYEIEINLGLFNERRENWVLNNELFVDFANRDSFTDQPIYNMFEFISSDGFAGELENQVWLTSKIISELEETKLA